MATSGTSTFSLDIADILEEAHELAGMELRTGYQMRSARRSLDLLMIEWANRGYNLWLVDESSFTTTSGTTTYNLDLDCVDVIEANLVMSDGTERALKRISAADYMRISNKASVAVPSLIWVNRQITRPVANLWQVPDATYTVKYWHLRRVEDSSSGVYTPDVPFRFLPAMIAGLAHKLAGKSTEQAHRTPFLEAEYERQFSFAAAEDRERTSFYIRPRLR
jgi:hypothetical protein